MLLLEFESKRSPSFFFWRCFAVSLPLSFSLLLVFRGWWKEGWEGSQKQEAIASEPQGPGKEKKLPPSTTAGQTTSREILATSWETND